MKSDAINLKEGGQEERASLKFRLREFLQAGAMLMFCVLTSSTSLDPPSSSSSPWVSSSSIFCTDTIRSLSSLYRALLATAGI